MSQSTAQNNDRKPGRLYVVAAPSGAGKTSLCKALLERLDKEGGRGLYWSVSYTTRDPRPGEVDGVDYFFVDDDTFDRMVENGEFAEWANVHSRRYGTSKEYLERSKVEGTDLLLEIDIQGARQLKNKLSDAAFIFILPPSWPELEKRLRGRATEDEEAVKGRLETAKSEMLEWKWFDYIIVNEDFDDAVDKLRAVVISVRHARGAMESVVEPIVKELDRHN